MVSILTTNWHLMRIARLLIGGMGIVEYLTTKEPFLLLIGVFLCVQGLLNLGCGGSGACDLRNNKL